MKIKYNNFGEVRWSAFALLIFIFIAILLVLQDSGFLKISSSKSVPVAPPQQTVEEPVSGELIRRDWLDPSRIFTVQTFFAGEREIGHINVSESTGEVLEQVGTIPDGEIKFENISKPFYGTVSYSNGVQDGLYRVFSKETEKIYLEEFYNRGKLVSRKEFFPDGKIRMEEDYSDVREKPIKNENGIGKVYFQNGQMKYEWHVTHRDAVAFKKAYNQDGDLIMEKNYDILGEVIQNVEK